MGVYNLDGNCLVNYTYDAWGNFTSSAMVGTLTSEELLLEIHTITMEETIQVMEFSVF